MAVPLELAYFPRKLDWAWARVVEVELGPFSCGIDVVFCIAAQFVGATSSQCYWARASLCDLESIREEMGDPPGAETTTKEKKPYRLRTEIYQTNLPLSFTCRPRLWLMSQPGSHQASSHLLQFDGHKLPLLVRPR